MGKIKSILLLSFFLIISLSYSQVVEEIIQLDTIFETYKVNYQQVTPSSYHYKKVAVFASDSSKIAIEKVFTSLGQNGIYKVYYPSGRLKVLTVFANNNINGEWTWYDKNGIILVKGNYKNGVKNGYWAYKYLRIYGRYKNGVKHKKWIRVDKNENKHRSYYKDGVLIHGEGSINDKIPAKNLKDSTSNKEELINKGNTKRISKEYEQAISFLKLNIILKKAIKAYFGVSLRESQIVKKYFKNDIFRFAISPSILTLSYSSFYKESKDGKIKVVIIDSLLKSSTVTLYSDTTHIIRNDSNLFQFSTNKTSPMVVYFGELKNNLMRIDVVKYNEAVDENKFVEKYNAANENQKFSVLLYFNNKGDLKGAEYQKP